MRKRRCASTFLAVVLFGIVFFFVGCVGKAAGAAEEPTEPFAAEIIQALVIAAEGNERPNLQPEAGVAGIEHLAGIDLEGLELLPVETVAEEPKLWTDYDAELIGRTIWGEAGGVKDPAERAAVAWCILNRVDAWGQTIEQVVTKPHQFYGYRPKGDCPQAHIDLAKDVLERWAAEKAGEENVGRVLPTGYLYFLGDGKHNHFTIEWKGTNTWDWSLTSPY